MQPFIVLCVTTIQMGEYLFCILRTHKTVKHCSAAFWSGICAAFIKWMQHLHVCSAAHELNTLRPELLIAQR